MRNSLIPMNVTTQIYPEDRGTNYSVKIAGEIVSLLKEKVRKL